MKNMLTVKCVGNYLVQVSETGRIVKNISIIMRK